MLTKKEKKELDSKHVIVEASPGGLVMPDRFYVHMSLTEGQLFSLAQGMKALGAVSAIANDIGSFIRNACERAGIDL